MKHTGKIVLALLALFLKFSDGEAQSATQPLSQQVETLAQAIAKDNILKSEAVGAGGTRTKQWQNFERLNEVATTQELVRLTSHENGVVRCYAFQGLAGRPDADVFPILIQHLNDTMKITTFFGCIMDSQPAGDYFLAVVTPNYIDEHLYKLTADQQAVIDSILLFGPNVTIEAKYTLLEALKPNQRYYHRIQEIAIVEKNPIAIVALSKYKNKNDIELIKTLFDDKETEYYAAYAAREFPDAAFYSYLTHMFEREWAKSLYNYSKWNMLYLALAEYPAETTYKLFERTVETKDEFRYRTLVSDLLRAINTYPAPIFEPLRNKIRLEPQH